MEDEPRHSKISYSLRLQVMSLCKSVIINQRWSIKSIVYPISSLSPNFDIGQRCRWYRVYLNTLWELSSQGVSKIPWRIYHSQSHRNPSNCVYQKLLKQHIVTYVRRFQTTAIGILIIYCLPFAFISQSQHFHSIN